MGKYKVDTAIHSPTDTVAYHQQDTSHWCASACALMVLHTLGVTRSAGFPLDQKRVRMVAQNSARSDPTYQWVAAPDGLTAALNYFCERSDVALPDKQGATRRWELVAADTEEEVSRYIVWTLWHYRSPAIALVFGMQHWLVVGGCVTSAPPKGPDDTGYDIIGFHLSDPWPPIPRELARNDHFQHMDRREPTGSFVAIDGCGSGWQGDPNSDVLGGRGVALRYVSYNDWRVRDHSTPDRRRHTGYMTGIPPTLKLTTRRGKPDIPVRSRWVGKFLAICDPVTTTQSRRTTATSEPAERFLTGLPTTPQAPKGNPQSLQQNKGLLLRQISPAEAIEVATQALSKESAYLEQPLQAHTTTHDGAKQVDLQQDRLPSNAAQAGEPLLVEWLDEPGTYHLESAYYIIPFTSHGAQHTAVRIAARMPFWLKDAREEQEEKSKLFLGFNMLAQNSRNNHEARQASAIMGADRARTIITGGSFRGTQGERIAVPNTYTGTGRAVWKPCIESFDPYCPFYEFAIQAAENNSNRSEPAYLYVRAFDGKVFTHLTEHFGGA